VLQVLEPFLPSDCLPHCIADEQDRSEVFSGTAVGFDDDVEQLLSQIGDSVVAHRYLRFGRSSYAGQGIKSTRRDNS
jgi:hypothetical protein